MSLCCIQTWTVLLAKNDSVQNSLSNTHMTVMFDMQTRVHLVFLIKHLTPKLMMSGSMSHKV